MNPSALAQCELTPAEIIQADKSDRVIAWTCISLLLVGLGYWINEYQHRDAVQLLMQQCMADHGIAKKEWYSPSWKPLRGACWSHARQLTVEGEK